jgi:hypothetical protein
LAVLALLGCAGCCAVTKDPTDTFDVVDVAAADSAKLDSLDALAGTGLVGQRPYRFRVPRIYDPCAGGAAELWTIRGAGHLPLVSPEWASTVYDWLIAHARP